MNQQNKHLKIGLISDTHGYIDSQIIEHFKDADEIWHAGDVGTDQVADQLESLCPLRAVYGNIDGREIRQRYPEHQVFHAGQLKVWITHIGGYPPAYTPTIRKQLDEIKPDIFICGHSHILKVMPDKNRSNLLHINPGAAGQQGFHKMRTIMTMETDGLRITDLKVIELGLRGRI